MIQQPLLFKEPQQCARVERQVVILSGHKSVSSSLSLSAGESQVEKENPALKIREAFAMTQAEFAAAVGLSYSTVQGYERGARISDAGREKLVSFLLGRKRPDLVSLLEEEASLATSRVSRDNLPRSTRVDRRGPQFDAKELHSMLDEVLISGDPDAIRAVESNLVLFSKYVRGRRPGRSSGAAKGA